MKRIAERVTSARSAMVGSLVVVITIGVIATAAWEVFRTTIIISPIAVPEALKEDGYTAEIITQRLLDEYARIASRAETEKQRGRVAVEWQQADIEVPGVGLSMKSVVNYVKAFVGLPNPRFGGEIVMDGDDFRLRLRLLDGRGHMSEIGPERAPDIAGLLRHGARELMKLTDPYVLAAYLYRHRPEGDDGDRAVVDAILYCLTNEPKDDDPWAYNLWGLLYEDRGEYEKAIELYKTALRLDGGFAHSYWNWGWAMIQQGYYSEAARKFQTAIAQGGGEAKFYDDWGYALFRNGEYEAAIRKYRKAVRLDPERTITYLDWGFALVELGRWNSAAAKFQKAIDVDPSYLDAYFAWGEMLFDQGDIGGGNAVYQRAVEFGPARVYATWGDILDRHRQYAEAASKFEMAAGLEPDYSQHYWRWGDVLNALRDTAGAAAKYAKADELSWQTAQSVPVVDAQDRADVGSFLQNDKWAANSFASRRGVRVRATTSKDKPNIEEVASN